VVFGSELLFGLVCDDKVVESVAAEYEARSQLLSVEAGRVKILH
jgi:hypothetical protein